MAPPTIGSGGAVGMGVGVAVAVGAGAVVESGTTAARRAGGTTAAGCSSPQQTISPDSRRAQAWNVPALTSR